MRTALIHPGAIGDLVLTLPLVQTLARRERNAVELVASSQRAQLFAGRSAVSSARSLDDLPLAELFDSSAQPPVRVSEKLADWLAGCQRIIVGLPSEAFVANLRLVFTGPVVALDVRPSAIEASHLHASEFLHRQLFDSPPPTPELFVSAEELRQGRELLGQTERPVAVIHPGSGGVPKCWPMESFAQVAAELAGQGWQVVFVLGPAEQDRMPVSVRANLAGARAEEFRVLHDLSLPQLLCVIAAADTFLGNDSGPTHLAAALGKPTVALFGPTDPATWSPRGRSVRVLRGQPDQSDWHLDPTEVARTILAAQSRSPADPK